MNESVGSRARLPRLRPAGSPAARPPSNRRKRGRPLASGADGVRPGSRSVPGGPCSSPGHAPRPPEGRSRLGADQSKGAVRPIPAAPGDPLSQATSRLPRIEYTGPRISDRSPSEILRRAARSRRRTALGTDAARRSSGRRAKGPRGAPETLACPGAPSVVWSWMIERAQEPQRELRDLGSGQPRIGGLVGAAPGPSRTSLGSNVTWIRPGGVADAGPSARMSQRPSRFACTRPRRDLASQRPASTARELGREKANPERKGSPVGRSTHSNPWSPELGSSIRPEDEP
jgi:hypothetical protein